MSDWHKPTDKSARQRARVSPDADLGVHRAAITCPVWGPIRWSERNKVWLDILSSREAGTMIAPDQVGLWTLWEPIMPAQLREKAALAKEAGQ